MAPAVRRACFIHAADDPAASGELRRLGVPALLLEPHGWSCRFVPASNPQVEEADVVIVPVAALSALPRIAGAAAPSLVLEVDGDPDLDAPECAAVLEGLGGRIRVIVARTAAAAAWARRHAPDASIRIAFDSAADGVTLDAAAVRFDAGMSQAGDANWPERFELWFAEPGERIDDTEAATLAASWRPREAAVAVAPPAALDLLEQHGLDVQTVLYTPERLDEALLRAARCVFAGPETSGLLRRLARARAAGAALSADPRLDSHEPVAVAAQWAQILDDVVARAPDLARSSPVNVLFLLDLIQDLDLALPVLDVLRRREDVTLRVVISGWLRRRSPRVALELGARDLFPEIYDRASLEAGERPELDGVDAVVAVVESNRSAHTRAHGVFQQARRLGVPSFSFQHGVENLGLNAPLADDEKDLSLLSEHLFVWFPEDRTPDSVQPALRPRLVHVGRPTSRRAPPGDLLGALSDFDKVAAVFENLHWNRYDVSWRRRFLFDCAEFAAADPSRAVVLKPHHGGLWSVRNKHLIPQWPTNLILADPTDTFWEPHTAPALIQAADLVITTPSTVALDAAQAGRPVAVAAYGLDLPTYAPLPLLHELRDWLAFAEEGGSPVDARRRAGFLSRSNRRGDAAGEAAACIVRVARQRAAARHRREEIVA